MKIAALISIYLLVTLLSFGQNNSKEFSEFIKKGDSLYKVKDYEKAAIIFSSAISLANSEQGNTVNNTRWKTASSWSLGNYFDSAFAQLNAIIHSNKATPYYIKRILIDKDFAPLHTDKRWQPLIDSIYKAFLASISKDIIYPALLG